eukprot:m.267561 g.267561  ORF g.267561 m.267561 type:complete len:110 (-) comp15642_c0_seq3:650-979(-)
MVLQVRPVRYVSDTHILITSLDKSEEHQVSERAIEFIEPSTDAIQTWFHTTTSRVQAEKWLMTQYVPFHPSCKSEQDANGVCSVKAAQLTNAPCTHNIVVFSSYLYMHC